MIHGRSCRSDVVAVGPHAGLNSIATMLIDFTLYIVTPRGPLPAVHGSAVVKTICYKLRGPWLETGGDLTETSDVQQLSSTVCYGDSFTLYMQMMFVPRRKHLWTSMACYWDSFTILYVDDVRTSKETHVWASTA
jgi:hypothetical protein